MRTFTLQVHLGEKAWSPPKFAWRSASHFLSSFCFQRFYPQKLRPYLTSAQVCRPQS